MASYFVWNSVVYQTPAVAYDTVNDVVTTGPDTSENMTYGASQFTPTTHNPAYGHISHLFQSQTPAVVYETVEDSVKLRDSISHILTGTWISDGHGIPHLSYTPLPESGTGKDVRYAHGQGCVWWG